MTYALAACSVARDSAQIYQWYHTIMTTFIDSYQIVLDYQFSSSQQTSQMKSDGTASGMIVYTDTFIRRYL